MKIGSSPGFGDYRTLVGAMAVMALGIALFPGEMAQAASQYDVTCDFCHRMPPLDSPSGTRDAATGAVKGNHQEHAGTTADSCVKCHGNSVLTYPTDHRTKSIQVRGNINDSPASGYYSRAFFNQTSVPPNPLGFCANVNCHFESVTPPWGSAVLVPPGDCNQCHGVPPNTGNHPVAGSKHGGYYGTGTGSCQKCHPDHLAEALPFRHATSAANRGVVVNFTGAPNSGGAYSNDGRNFLPSQHKAAFGTCTNVYCHSDGTSLATGLAPAGSVAWGGSLTCSGCHGNPPAYPNGVPKANSHGRHNFGCTTCHAGTTADQSRHANQAYDLLPGNGASFAYVYAAGGGTCSAISCHGNGTAVWGTPLACDGCHDGPPATASHLKHYGGTVAQAAYGDTSITQDYGASGTTYIFGCGNCHPMDPAKHGDGIVEVELYDAAAPAGSLKQKNPASASYATGAPLTDSRGYSYSNGTCSNVYCHSYRSWTTPTGVPSYDTTCTPSVPADLQTITNYKSVTWGGPPLGCTGCHANPPQTRYPENGGGAGDSHAWVSDPFDYGYGVSGTVEYLHNNDMYFETYSGNPLSCTYCHNDTVGQMSSFKRIDTATAIYAIMSSVPIKKYSKHVNGTNDVAFEKQIAVPTISYFSNWSGQKLTNATYDPATKTCSNVACHPLRTNVKWGTPYKGGVVNDCERCHDSAGSCPDEAAALSRQPSISSTPKSTLASPGYTYSYALSASEPGGGALTYTLPVAPTGMTISSAGLVSWTPTADQFGTASVEVIVSSNASGGTLIAIQEFTISVVSPQPVITSTPVTTASVWGSYSYAVTSTVPSGVPAVSYALTPFPPGMAVNASTGRITWTPTDLQTGTYPVTVTATTAGYSASQSFTVTVGPSPITFSFAPVTTGATQVAYSYTAIATKSGGGTITYSITGKPAWMTFNAATGAMTGTPSASQNGSYTITVTATSGVYANRQTFTIVISASPITITPPTVLTAPKSVLYNPSPNITYSMAGGMTGATYSIASKPTWLNFNTSTGTISGTPPTSGSYTFTVTATKGSSTASKQITVTVP